MLNKIQSEVEEFTVLFKCKKIIRITSKKGNKEKNLFLILSRKRKPLFKLKNKIKHQKKTKNWNKRLSINQRKSSKSLKKDSIKLKLTTLKITKTHQINFCWISGSTLMKNSFQLHYQRLQLYNLDNLSLKNWEELSLNCLTFLLTKKHKIKESSIK